MFQKAVLRLTLWYLGGIVLLSFFFSAMLYRMSTAELNAILAREHTMRNNLALRRFPGFEALMEERIDQIEQSKNVILWRFVYGDLAIAVVGGAVSYFLAKRTMEPIEEAWDAQNRFAADASHELRTPLTAMKTEIEVALRNPDLDTKEARTLLKSNLEEVDTLQRLSSSLLRLARHEQRVSASGQSSLKDAIDAAVHRLRAVAEKKGVTVHVDSRDFLVPGDSDNLTELVAILLDNAVKYSPKEGEVHISSGVRGQSAFIRVKDNGIGISKEDLPNIFDRFYRSDHARSKSAAPGYGLGLSIAKKIVEVHKGTIEASSSLGEGSVFTVHLPLKPER